MSGCSPQTANPLVGAQPEKSSFQSIDLGFRGQSAREAYGTVAGGARSAPTAASFGGIFGGTPVEPRRTASAEDAPVRYADASGQITSSAKGYTLNFENADVAAVCKTVLGDILELNYTVDRRVVGQITLTSSKPIPRTRLLRLLESTLTPIGASIVKDGGLYKVAPVAESRGLGNVDYSATSEGFGTTVIQAKFIPAATLGRLLEGFGSKPGSIRVDPGTNYVIVQGTGGERRSALDAAETVDVDWLRSQAVAILPVAYSSPETIIAELNQVLDTGEGGISRNVIKLEPMARLNAILAVSRRKDALELVKDYVRRLDRNDTMSSGVKVYRLQYAQAKVVAAVLNDMFGSGTGSQDADGLEPSARNPLEKLSPGGGQVQPGPANSGGNPAGGGGAPFGVLNVSLSNTGKAKPDSGSAYSGSTSPGRSPTGSSRVRVAADVSSNSLFIYANGVDYRTVERAIHQIDRRPVQVDIEATIAEITLNRDLQYGVQFFLEKNLGSLGLGGASGVPITTTQNAGLNLLLGAASNPKVLLNAMQTITNVKILSSPSLVVLDRQPAVLQVGDQVPILTQQAQGVSTVGAPVVNNVEYRDTGVILNVLPRVNANGVVSLDIEQQISAVSSTDPTSLTPTISQRKVRSTIAVANGQTVMLAGLISDKQSSTRTGLPGISNIRFLSDLLSTRDSALDRTEIVIFIKPRIIENNGDAQQLAEEFREKLVTMERRTPRSGGIFEQ